MAIAYRSEVIGLREREAKRHTLGAPLLAAIYEWFLRDADVLVFDDGTEPGVSLVAAFEQPEVHGARASKHFAAVAQSALLGGSPLAFLRLRCECADATCVGCGGCQTEITPFQIPVKVSRLLAEVKRHA